MNNAANTETRTATFRLTACSHPGRWQVFIAFPGTGERAIYNGDIFDCPTLADAEIETVRRMSAQGWTGPVVHNTWSVSVPEWIR